MVAPVGTVVDIDVPAGFTVYCAAGIPLNVTFVAPVKPEPVIVTDAPCSTGGAVDVAKPLVGLNPDMVITVKLVELVTVPPGVLTATSP